MRRYQRLVYTVPRRAGLNDSACDDVFQATFTRLVENLRRIGDGARVRAWLVTTARRETLRFLVLQGRQGELPAMPLETHAGGGDPQSAPDPFDALASASPLPEQVLESLQDLDRLRTAVDLLEPRARQFAELMFLQEEPLSYLEIAARVGMAEGSIGPTRARVLDKLRTLMARL